MKNLSKYALMAALIISPLTAVQANQHMMKDGMAMHAMDDAKMEMMQKHMSEMEQLLENAKKEQGPKKRQKMLDDHAKSMGKMTEMMGGQMDGMGKMGGHHGKKMSDAKDMNSTQKMEMMEKRMAMMEKRMAMMERMMKQMMGHTAEKSKKHDHMKMK